MNKNRRTIRTLVVLLLVMIFSLSIAACGNEHEHYEAEKKHINERLLECTGKGLTEKEVNSKLAEFHSIEEMYGGKLISIGPAVAPHFRLLRTDVFFTPTKNTRYDIEVLEKNEDGIYIGLKLTAYDIEPEETSAPVDSTSAEILGLPINEIVGTYQESETLQAILKGKDEEEEGRVIKEEEFVFAYVITAIDDKKILIEFGGVKLGEGIYDPVSCSCDFIVAPEFYESMHATSTGDKTMRITFSEVDGNIQFELIAVGSEGEPTIAVKV